MVQMCAYLLKLTFFIRPFIGMTFMPPHILQGIGDVTDEQLAQNAAEYVKFVTNESVTVQAELIVKTKILLLRRFFVFLVQLL